MGAFKLRARRFRDVQSTPSTAEDCLCGAADQHASGKPQHFLSAQLRSRCTGHALQQQRNTFSIKDLASGPYLNIAGFLDTESLDSVDAACSLLREINRGQQGPWHQFGLRAFRGLELEQVGMFHVDRKGGCSFAAPDWKRRFRQFVTELPMFRCPFDGREIAFVGQPDEIAWSRCSFCIEDHHHAQGVYWEVEVLANPDNVSLAVVDFDTGGCSSVTFSPDTGAVIREKKVCETPRKVEGAYIQPLLTATPGEGFEGLMGLYLCRGHLAFFRRQAVRRGDGDQVELCSWESTGFVTDLSWSEGTHLTPCLAFRNEGMYHVRTVYLSSSPPVMPEWNAAAYEEGSWNSLDWDGGQDAAPEL